MRFESNVKFPIIGNSDIFELVTDIPIMANYIRTSFDGSIAEICSCQTNYEEWDCKKISFAEAVHKFAIKKIQNKCQ